MVQPEIPEAIFQSICEDLRALWNDAAFRPAFSSQHRVNVVTKTSSATDAPIRGMTGVTVSLDNQQGFRHEVLLKESLLPSVELGSELPRESQIALTNHI